MPFSPDIPDLGGLLGPLPKPTLTPSGGLLHPMEPNVQGAPMPTITPPKQPFVDRLLARLFPTAPLMQGLLTPDELSNARYDALIQAGGAMSAASSPHVGPAPNFGSVLAAGLQAGHTGFNEAVGGAAQMAQAQMEMERKQREMAKRQAIGEALAPQPGETPEQRMDRIIEMYDTLIRSGDIESAKVLNPAVQQILAARAAHQSQKPPQLLRNDLGDRVEWIDPVTRQIVRTDKKGVAPKAPGMDVYDDPKFVAAQKDKIIGDFFQQTKDFARAKQGWDILMGARKSPGIATPFAVTDAYARITNPNGVVRPSTQEMIENLGGVGQRMRKYWAKHAGGALPQDILDDFTNAMYSMMMEHYADYKRARESALTRGRQMRINDLEPLLLDYDIKNPVAGRGAPDTTPADTSSAGRAFNTIRNITRGMTRGNP